MFGRRKEDHMELVEIYKANHQKQSQIRQEMTQEEKADFETAELCCLTYKNNRMKKRAKKHSRKEIKEELRLFHKELERIIKNYANQEQNELTERDQKMLQQIEESGFLANYKHLAPFYHHIRSLSEEEKSSYSQQIEYLTDELIGTLPKGKTVEELVEQRKQAQEKERFLQSRLSPEEWHVYKLSVLVGNFYYRIVEYQEPRSNRSEEASTYIQVYQQELQTVVKSYPPTSPFRERDYEVAQLIEAFQIRTEDQYVPNIYYYLSDLSMEEQYGWSKRATRLFEYIDGFKIQ